jgi:hypothetical protein
MAVLHEIKARLYRYLHIPYMDNYVIRIVFEYLQDFKYVHKSAVSCGGANGLSESKHAINLFFSVCRVKNNLNLYHIC